MGDTDLSTLVADSTLGPRTGNSATRVVPGSDGEQSWWDRAGNSATRVTTGGPGPRGTGRLARPDPVVHPGVVGLFHVEEVEWVWRL